MMGYIELRDVQKEFILGNNTIKAVNGIDVSIERGERLRISGRSGSGKSTLLNLIAGLEKTTSGEIIIDGNHIEKMGERDRIRFRRKSIGFIFQSYNLLPQYTALENVALPLILRGIAPRQRVEMAKEIMDQVGIYSHAKHRPNEMSGGQQQRVGIARALVTGPPIVFADEPTGNLDTRTSKEVMDILTKLFIEKGTTFILVSHDEDTKPYTTRTIYLEDGKTINLEMVKEENN